MKNLIYVLVSVFALAFMGQATAEPTNGAQVPAIEPANVVYPRQALRRGDQGEVLVRYRVNEQGRAEDIQVMQSSNPVFNSAAVRAVRESRYVRTFEGNRPVEVDGVLKRFVFALEKD